MNKPLLRYLRHNVGGHTADKLAKDFGVKPIIMYMRLKRLLGYGLINAVMTDRRRYYGIYPQWRTDWIEFYKSTYYPKKTRTAPMTLEDFKLLVPQTLAQRIKNSIRRMRIRLARWISPY